MLSVAILSGGLASRLRPFTEKTPKSLIEVAGKPFIYHQLDFLVQQNISSVILCVGYLGELIKEVVGDGSKWGINISYSFDGNQQLGTGGALRKALPLLGESFFVLYGDSYLPINFSDVQSAYTIGGKKGLMTVLNNQNKWDKSNVQFKSGQIIEYNKTEVNPQMQYIDYGLGILRNTALNNYSNLYQFDLSEVYNELSISGELTGYEVFDRFYEIGSLQGIVDTQNYLLNRAKNIQL